MSGEHKMTFDRAKGFVQGYGVDWPDAKDKVTLSLYKNNKSISIDLDKELCRKLSEQLLDRFQ